MSEIPYGKTICSEAFFGRETRKPVFCGNYHIPTGHCLYFNLVDGEEVDRVCADEFVLPDDARFM